MIPSMTGESGGTLGPSFFYFHAIFGKIVQNDRLTPQPLGKAGKSWIRLWFHAYHPSVKCLIVQTTSKLNWFVCSLHKLFRTTQYKLDWFEFQDEFEFDFYTSDRIIRSREIVQFHSFVCGKSMKAFYGSENSSIPIGILEIKLISVGPIVFLKHRLICIGPIQNPRLHP